MALLQCLRHLPHAIYRAPRTHAIYRATAVAAASYSSSPAAANDEPAALRTSLYDLHVAHAGKMVPFAGYLLPVQYGQVGIAASHRHCRRAAAVFDVSHMQQTMVRGAAAVECFESICTADVHGLAEGAGTLSVLTTPAGGIYDDLIVTRLAKGELFVVSNAGRRAIDRELMAEAAARFRARGKDVHVEFWETEQRALVAVQGPLAVEAVRRLCDGAAEVFEGLWFMRSVEATVAGVAGCRVTRCGYTGEDGVEVSVAADRAAHVVEALLEGGGEVQLAGLGARDSLRLEAGLCLYGSDIDETTNPVEAGLAWLVGKLYMILYWDQIKFGIDENLKQTKCFQPRRVAPRPTFRAPRRSWPPCSRAAVSGVASAFASSRDRRHAMTPRCWTAQRIG